MIANIALIVSAALIAHYAYGVPAVDTINGALEFGGGLFICMSIQALYRAKIVRGVSWKHVAFFSAWGYWNLYFYPSLDQWFSTIGATFLVVANTAWLVQIAYYIIKEKRSVANV